MKPEKISVMDEDYLLYSLSSEKLDSDIADGAVILLPSLTADFSVATSQGGAGEPADYYTAAVCAAAFLVSKRGLPLPEITFETPRGFIEIICTGGGLFSFTMPKCKLLFINSDEIMGCDVESADVLVGAKYRVIHTPNVEGFDNNTLPHFLLRGEAMPAAVVHSYFEGGKLNFSAYSSHSVQKPSTPSIFAAAAYHAYRTVGKDRRFSHGKSIAEVNLTQVKVTVEAFIQN